MTFKTGWLEINQLVYAWVHLRDGDERSKTGLRCLELMDEWRAVNSICLQIINDLNLRKVEHKYTPFWYESLVDENETIHEEVEMRLGSMHSSTKASLTASDNGDLWKAVRRAAIVSCVQGNFQQGLGWLSGYHDIVMFHSQINDCEALVANRYFEYSFLHYILVFYGTIFSSEEGNMAEGFKMLEPISKKIDYYFNKNDIILHQNSHLDEMKYYKLIKFYELAVLFKQFHMAKFLTEFMSLLKQPDFAWLIHINPKVLCFFEISLVFLKPFNQLGLLDIDDDILLEEINHYQFSNYLFNNILSQLAQCNYAKVQQVFADGSFTNEFNAKLGPFLPVNIKKSSFLEYLHTIIDSKNFMLIMSRTQAIPKEKLIATLGYSEPSKQTALHNHLLLLIAALGLGKDNIRYSYADEVFYNEEKKGVIERNQLSTNVANLTVEAEAESLASIMKGLLVEKFMY